MPEPSILLLFHSIHDVLRAEKALKEKGISQELIPVPRNLSSDCGMSIRTEGDPSTIRQSLGSIPVMEIYLCDGNDYIPCEM